MFNKKKKIDNPRTRSEDDNSTEVKTSFRRGQTISGYKKETSDRSKRHDLVVQRRKFGSFFLFIIGLAVVFLFFLLQFTSKTEVYLQGGQKIEDQARYNDVIDDYYGDHPVERLRFFLNGEKLLEQLQSELPEVSKIESVKSSSFTQTDFTFVMREPVANWSASSGKTYYVDSSGVAFEKNYFEQPAVSVSDESGVKVDDGNIIVSNSFLSFIGRTIGSAKDNDITIDRIVIPPSSLRQVEMYIAGSEFPIKFITSREPEKQVTELKQVLDYLAKNSITPQYIDVRVKGKAFYQ